MQTWFQTPKQAEQLEGLSATDKYQPFCDEQKSSLSGSLAAINLREWSNFFPSFFLFILSNVAATPPNDCSHNRPPPGDSSYLIGMPDDNAKV